MICYCRYILLPALKRRLADSERKQEDNKRKSQAFETLIEIGKSKPDAKRRRLDNDSTQKSIALAGTQSKTKLDKADDSILSQKKNKTTIDQDEDYSPSRDSDK